MNPRNSLAFLTSVLILLGIISVIIPEGGITISEDYSIRFGKLADLAPRGEHPYADISAIINQTSEAIVDASAIETVELDFGDLAEDSLGETAIIIDSIVEAKPVDTIRASAYALRKKTFAIEFPKGDQTLLFTFFDKLASVSEGRKPLRILHYGDSQIEGDRISGVIRQHFQEQFGGSGPGFICPFEEQGFASQVLLSHEGNWHRYARFIKKDSIVPHARFGHLTSFARFTPLEADDSAKVQTGTIYIQGKEKWLYPLRQQFRSVDIYLGYNEASVFIEFSIGDSLMHMAGVEANKGVQKVSWTSPVPISTCNIKFTGSNSPDIYGIALDDTAGIALDNIPLRGSSGLEFTRVSKANLASIYKHLDVGLIILQFGVNVVPNIRTDYTYYEEKFTRQIVRLKNLFPNIPILIVGVTDMSRKVGNYYQSYPNIELIRDVQKKVAFANDCAFWDLYSAMGGKNSMPSWVFAKPSLAKKDFTHFNYKGAKIIGQMFYNSLMNEYNAYKTMMARDVEDSQ